MGEIEEAPKRDWKLMWAVAAFLIGILFSAGMGWGRNSNSLDNMALQLARLDATLNVLTEKYTTSDKTISNALQKMEDHLTFDDQRLDKLESGQRR